MILFAVAFLIYFFFSQNTIFFTCFFLILGREEKKREEKRREEKRREEKRKEEKRKEEKRKEKKRKEEKKIMRENMRKKISKQDFYPFLKFYGFTI